MSRAPQIEPGFPLDWPPGRPRTPWDRKPGLWRHDGHRLTFSVARKRLDQQIQALTRPCKSWRVDDQILSTNIRFTLSDARDQNVSRRDPDDPGVAFYFTLDGEPHVLACDRWDTVYDNIAAIAAHVEALRGQERWGVADLAQAFAGHVALQPPDPWWRVLGLERGADFAAITRAWRTCAKTHHPDAGGNRAEWDRINAAFEAGKMEAGR